MIDIVERLRLFRPGIEQDAADEIERLRTEAEERTSDIIKQHATIMRQRAIIAGLTGVLDAIVPNLEESVLPGRKEVERVCAAIARVKGGKK